MLPNAKELENSGQREVTGAAAACFRRWIDARTRLTVVLTTGEQLRGRIRYDDRHCFSLGQRGRGPNLLVRKENVRYICEDPEDRSEG